jgi:hypothetical protein
MTDEDDFDAGAFRAEATGESTSTSTTADHAAAEGTEPSDDLGSKSTLREMLLSTDPKRSLEDVEDPWDPDRGGTTRIYRGLMKATGVDGMPAVVDVVIGVVEAAQDLNLEEPDDQEDDQEAVDFA